MIYVLLLLLSFLFIIAYIIFDNNLFSPVVVIIEAFIFSTLCAIYNKSEWNFSLSGVTILTIVSFIVFAMIFAAFGKAIVYKKYPERGKSINIYNNIIKVGFSKTMIIFVFGIIVCILYFKDVYTIGVNYGSSNGISDIISNYRAAVSYGFSDDSISLFPKIGYKIITISSYIYMYIFINNFFATKTWKNILFLFPILPFIICTFISAGRYNLLKFAVSILYIYYFLFLKWRNRKIIFTPKTIIKLFFSLIIVLCLFYFTKKLVGRNSSDFNLVSYVTYYSGGSIPLFDLFLKDMPEKSAIFGKETFYAIINFISKVFNIDSLNYIPHKEFRSSGGIVIGNVYTFLRSYIYDFGFFGAGILVSISSYLYSYIFYDLIYKLKRNNYDNPIDLRIVLFSYITFGFVFSFVNEEFYGSVLSVNTLIMIVFSFLIRFYLVGKKEIIYYKSRLNLQEKMCIKD